mmetsp:Transcript_31486/g.93889  ORF Transcript_31486/g.93889 Transcript_31486/m.93889 type:complete len:127 (-) Transcript_31486:210-590(-)
MRVGFSLMLGASSSFISPFGYQTNLMVFNAGNLRFWDLARIGIFFQVWMWFGATVILGLPDQQGAVIGISIALVVAVAAVCFAWAHLPCMDPLKQRLAKLRTRSLWAVWRAHGVEDTTPVLQASST